MRAPRPRQDGEDDRTRTGCLRDGDPALDLMSFVLDGGSGGNRTHGQPRMRRLLDR